MGWPLRPPGEVPRVRRLVHLPDGRRPGHDRDGRRARLPRRRAVGARPAPGAEDAPERCGNILDGGERSSGARRRFPRAASTRCRRRFHAPGLLLCGDGVGSSTCRRSRASTTRSSRVGSRPRPRSRRCGAARRRRTGALASYDDAVRASFIWSDLHEVRNMRQVFGRGFYVGGALGGAKTVSKGASRRATARPSPTTSRRSRDRPCAQLPGAGRQAHLRQALVACSRRATGRATTSRTTSASRRTCRGSVAELWANLCPAQVYEVGARRRRHRRGRDRAVELRAVRGDHRQGRAPHAARGWFGPGVHTHVRPGGAFLHGGCRGTWPPRGMAAQYARYSSIARSGRRAEERQHLVAVEADAGDAIPIVARVARPDVRLERQRPAGAPRVLHYVAERVHHRRVAFSRSGSSTACRTDG